jgi:hypothetical protein
MVTRRGREDITPQNTSGNTFIGRNVYTTAKQGAKATLVYLLSDFNYNSGSNTAALPTESTKLRYCKPTPEAKIEIQKIMNKHFIFKAGLREFLQNRNEAFGDI